MKWMRFRVRTRTAAEDILVSMMQDIGLYGAQIEDHVPLTAAEKEQMFVDILPESGEDDGTAMLSFYLEETED
ncbi:MAG: 50S ribosomal protein L11 methyltransferase, partial [Lachnospiraceae bacterium]|nr:50S ribosomal protein L11 methyltransferase [Lachnospiraceae bacterium]